MKKRIVFVDDEQSVLDGLQNILRKQRKEWDMVFALGGQAALDELAKLPADVVVSDMRMPGLDGAALLERIRAQYPATTRIILSGHAEREAAVRAVPVTHQFLSKPCDAELLKSVITRACELGALLEDDRIRAAVSTLNQLPSPPEVYTKLTHALASTNTSLSEVAEIVQCDPALSAKVLQIVNSAYFGLPQRVATIQQAVTYLGIEPLRALSLNAGVFGTFKDCALPREAIERMQRAALFTGTLAQGLVAERKLGLEALTAGVVHDVGRLVLALGLPAEFAEVMRAAAESGRDAHEIEAEKLGVTHAEVGAYLLGAWGLPLGIVETTAYHHHPGRAAPGDARLLAAVHVAGAIVDHPGRLPSDLREIGVDLDFLEQAGLSSRLPEWRTIAEEKLKLFAEGGLAG